MSSQGLTLKGWSMVGGAVIKQKRVKTEQRGASVQWDSDLPVRIYIPLCPFYRRGNASSERWIHLSEVTQQEDYQDLLGMAPSAPLCADLTQTWTTMRAQKY